LTAPARAAIYGAHRTPPKRSPQTAKPATAKQLRYLRALANQTGTTFTPPQSSYEASKAIKEMQQRPLSSRHERDHDRGSVASRQGASDGASAGVDVRDDEITGYGSTATWTQGDR
jgi:hypothetical protein